MKMPEKEYSAGRGTVFLTGIAILSQGLAFAYRAALSRAVGAEVMGLYQLLMSAYGVMLSLTTAGLTACASNLTPQYLALGNLKGLEQMRRSCLLLLCGGSGVLAAAMVLWYDPVSVYLLGDARTQLGLILLLPCVLLTGAENLHKHIFYGSGRVRPPALTELAEQGIRAAAVLGLLMFLTPADPERTVGVIVVGMIICEVFSSLTLVCLHRRYFAGRWSQGRGEDLHTRGNRIRRIALPVCVTSLLGNVMGAANAALIPRKLVEGGMARGEAMSRFGVLCGMTLPMLSLPTVFLGALNLVMVPRLARAAALGQKERLSSRVCRSMTAVSVLILPALVLMVVLGPELSVLIFRETAAGDYLPVLAAAVALSSFRAVCSGVLSGVGKQGQGAAICLVCDVVQLAFVFSVALPGVGLKGFVAGTVLSELLGAVLSARCAARAAGIRLPVFESVTAPTLAALLAGLTGNLLFRYLRDCQVPLWVAGGAVCIYSVLLYLTTLQVQGVSVRKVFGREGADQ